MDPDELARLMNDYFQAAVSGCIHPTDGTVVRYIGDAIFAFWNAPEPQPDHAVRACEAALRFREQGKEKVRGIKLVTRIGLHTGVANVGNFGSETHVDYTAIGESVNLAARLESLNKYLGTSVLISGATKQEIGNHISTRYMGRFRLKGFENSVEVYEIIGGSSTANPSSNDDFACGLEAFRRRDFIAAQSAFSRALEAKPQDGPANFYSRHVTQLMGQKLPDNWKGEVELKEK